MDKLFLRQRGTSWFSREKMEEKHVKNGNHGVGLAVGESIMAGMNKGDVAVECISATLMKVRINSKRNQTVCLFLTAMAPLSARAPAEKNTFRVILTRWSRRYPVRTDSMFCRRKFSYRHERDRVERQKGFECIRT